MRKIITVLGFGLLVLGNPNYIFAQGPVNIGTPTGAYAFGGFDSLGAALSPLVNPIFTIAGIIVFIYFLIGAFRMVISNGDKNIIASAREEMTHGIVGLLLLILIFLAAKYLPAFFFSKTPGINDSGFTIIK